MELPADVALGELLPTVIELLGEDPDARILQLTRRDGSVLDSRNSLVDRGLHDGDVLSLVPADVPAPLGHADMCSAILDTTEDADRRPAEWSSPVLIVLWSAITVTVVLGLTGLDRLLRLVLLCAATVLILTAAVLVRRQQCTSIVLGVFASALAAASAWFVVPGLAGCLLASSALTAVALVGWRVLGHGADVFLPCSGIGLVSAAVSVAVLTGGLPATAVGPLLTTAALTALGLSPRWAARAGGLSPGAPVDVEAGVARARRTLTGLVVVCAATSMLGAVMTAVWAGHSAWTSMLTGLAVVVLLLRNRFHQDRRDWWAVRMAAGGIATVFTIQVALSAPRLVGWLCVAVLAVALTAIVGRRNATPAVPSDRVLAVLDAAAGAAVIPTACAAAGVFTAIGAVL